jgi:hypothetical protein
MYFLFKTNMMAEHQVVEIGEHMEDILGTYQVVIFTL